MTIGGLELANRILETVKAVAREKGFMYVGLGTLLYTGLAAVFWFIFAGILGVDEYGLLNYYLAIAAMGTTVSTLGLKTTIITFYPKEENINLVKHAYLATLIVGLAVCFILAILDLFVVAFLILAEIAFSMFISEILGKRKYREYALVSFSTRISQIVFSIVLYLILGIMGIFAGYIIALIIFGARYFITLAKSELSLQELKEKRSFTIYSYAHDLTLVSAGYFDKVLIGWILGLATLGYYHLAFQVYWILAVLPVALLNYLLPERSRGAIRREVEILGMAFSVLLSALAILLAPIIVPMIFPGFVISISLIQVMSLAVIPATVVSIWKARLFSEEESLTILLANIVAVTAEILGLFLFLIWLGIVGLAVAVVLSQMATMIFLEIKGRKKIVIRPRGKMDSIN